MAEQVIVCMRSLPQGTAREVSALGHRLAWRALGLLLGCADQQLFESGVRLAKEESGRPVWTGTDCFVSISHTGTTAAAAVSRVRIGIDLEPAGRQNLRVARRMFTENEQRWLSQQLQEGAQDAFARLWTLREAYAKWTGLGLAGLARRDQSFQPLEFAVDAQGKVRCSDSLCAAGCVRLGEHLLAVVLPSEVGAELILEEDDGSFKKIWKSA